MSTLPFQVCAITGVDGVLGYAQAHHFLKRICDEYGEGKVEMRLLCRDPAGLDELEKMGAHIIKTGYDNMDELVEHLSGVQYLIFVPRVTHTMLYEGTHVIQAAKTASVNYVAMYSCLGVDKVCCATRPEEWGTFKDLYCLELMMAKHFDNEQHCIFRIPLVAQVFYYLTPWVEEENKLYMPVRPGRKFAVSDLEDIIRAVYILSICVPEQPGKNQTLFQFTPSQRCMTPEEMAAAMTKGLELDRSIDYQTIDSRRLRKDLQELRTRKQFKEPLPSREMFAHPLGAYLTDAMIEHLLDFWGLAEEGHLDMVTDDLKKALGPDHPPRELVEFFKANRGNFDHLK